MSWPAANEAACPKVSGKSCLLWPEDVSNEVLREAVDNVRFQLGQSDRFLGGLRRSGAYRQHIDAVIREKGLPAELAVLPT